MYSGRASGRLLRDQPRVRLGRGRRALRQSAQRLLAAAARCRLHAQALRSRGAVLGARARDRADERGHQDDARLERPAPRRLRRLARTAAGARARVPPAGDRVCGQRGVPGRIRQASRARPAGGDARRRRRLRAAVDLAGERRCSLRGAPEVVQRAQRVARARRSPRGAGARGRQRGPGRARPVPRCDRPDVVGEPRRRDRGGRGRRGGPAARACGGDRAHRVRARPGGLEARAHVRLGGPHHPPARARLARPRRRSTSRGRAWT